MARLDDIEGVRVNACVLLDCRKIVGDLMKKETLKN
jgi:hypothetical protein